MTGSHQDITIFIDFSVDNGSSFLTDDLAFSKSLNKTSFVLFFIITLSWTFSYSEEQPVDIWNLEKKEVEIAYFGILEEFFSKGYGGYLLSEAIKLGFQSNVKRVWVHTCSLDHPNAILNYKSRGMQVFKNEILKRQAI